MAESTSGPLWPDRGGDHDPLGDLQRAMELIETQGGRPEPEPISPGLFRRMFGRLQWWLAAPIRAIDDARGLDDDVVVPPIRYELGAAADVSPDEFRARFRPSRLMLFAPPPDPSCVFCPATATEEIFLGWEFTDSRSPGPLERHVYGLPADDQATGVEARFARVCINHVGHSRFTRSDRPVDEL